MKEAKKAESLLRAVKELRRKYPESKVWTQMVLETLNYVVYGRRCSWINNNFPDLGIEAVEK